MNSFDGDTDNQTLLPHIRSATSLWTTHGSNCLACLIECGGGEDTNDEVCEHQPNTNAGP